MPSLHPTEAFMLGDGGDLCRPAHGFGLLADREVDEACRGFHEIAGEVDGIPLIRRCLTALSSFCTSGASKAVPVPVLLALTPHFRYDLGGKFCLRRFENSERSGGTMEVNVERVFGRLAV